METPAMQQNLAGKVAIVTGGSRGIGRAIVLELAARGANVVFSYAGNAAAAEETRAAAEALGVAARAIQADVASADAAATLVDAAKELGGVDILVNNAGITRDKLAARMSAEDFEAVIATNLTGAFYMAKAVLRPMMRARSGAIVNMSSVVGIHGNAGQVNYAASKAGLIGLTKSLAREVAGAGIRVNAVAPGFIATDMTDAMPEAAREATLAQIPARALGEPEGRGPRRRLPRLRRRPLHHRAGARRRRRHGHVAGSPGTPPRRSASAAWRKGLCRLASG